MNSTYFDIFIIISYHSLNGQIVCSSQVDLGNTIQETEIKLEDCGCKRKIQRGQINSNSQGNNWFNQTTCGKDAFSRGMGQKIIGMSLYGDYTMKRFKFKGYLDGIKENLNLMKNYYPGWILRIYTDYDVEDPVFTKICDLACNGQYSHLDICHVKKLPGTPFSDGSKIFGMNWRFFPTLDPQVDLYVSRDPDSRLSDREHAAVQDWLNSDSSIHVMRDHPRHDYSMLGCSWGTKLSNETIRSKWKKSWKSGLEDNIMWVGKHEWGEDQQFLDKYVWSWAQKDFIGHDSFHCQKYQNSKPFPTQRSIGLNNFVGSNICQNMTISVPCPLPCRPKDHKNWMYC